MFFSQTFRNIRRAREIIRILLKYGFEDLVVNTSLKIFIPEKRRLSWMRKKKPVFEYTRWERIRMAAEELGPTFVKGAQVLSNRPDVLPEALIKELQKLQSNVPPFDSEKAKDIIEHETGRKITDLFEYFEDAPIGSASIGQVHRARLIGGEEVVVKVQRPEVRDRVLQDIAIIKEVVRLGENYFKRQGILNPMDIVRSFERSMMKELTYLNEARNIEQFRNFYKDYTNFYVPKAYKQYSTDRVLVIELIKGCKITDIEQLNKWGLDPTKIAESGMDIYMTQIFEHGYFHADPHPGNVFVRKDGVICLIDFGMVGTLMKKDKHAFAGLFVAMAQEDPQMMAVYFRRLAIDGEISDMRAFEYDLNEIIEDYANMEISEASMADMSSSLQRIIYEYQLKVPGSIFLIMRAMAILEGIGRTIHPHFNTLEFMEPYGMKLLQEKFDPKALGKDLYSNVSQLLSFMTALPVEMKGILRQLRKGKLHIEVEHTGYRPYMQKLDFITNRLSLALVTSALFVSSAIAMHAKLPAEAMTASGLPYISLLGMSIGGGLGIFLLFAIWRSGR